MNKIINEYTEEEIQNACKKYLPLLYRVLKQNNHFLLFIQGCKKSSQNPLEILIENFKTNKNWFCLSYSVWSINISKARENWNCGWKTEYRGTDFKDSTSLEDYMIVIFGMIYNRIGSEYGYGIFYEDYLKAREIILEKKK